ncbi:MAG TPA: substrate-binding domain-containing protein [Candidatus Angelobacter sp.]|nr:substrate-binding domain-containing protein [Candidatus Angelobacter sp.]
MKKLSLVVALPGENAYLREQEAVARDTADRLNIGLRTMNANSDAVTQSQQLLEVIQSKSAPLPDAIVVEPVTAMGLPRVAEAAVAAGVAWVMSNAEADYLDRLRKTSKVPVFAVSQDHHGIGRLQAQQFSVLLPDGGSVLYLRGPVSNSLATRRAGGIDGNTPPRIRTKTLKIQWTEQNAYQSVTSWLRLPSVHAADVDLVSSQNTDFIMGARRAFQEHWEAEERQRWLNRLYTAAGLLRQTKPLVDQGVLTAAVATSLTMDVALEMLVRALKTGTQPPEHTFVQTSSYPSLEDLSRKRALSKPLAP